MFDRAVEIAFVLGHLAVIASPAFLIVGVLLYRRRQRRIRESLRAPAMGQLV